MLVVLSPAKRLDMSDAGPEALTEPVFAREAATLAAAARALSAPELQKLMGISDKLARLNAERFRAFGTMPRKAAVLAFAGDTYAGLEAASLEADEIAWAQEHLRILSGLYGVLRPLDAIEPYRLEMGSRLQTPRGRTLYEFWGERIARALARSARAIGTDVLINCASREYFGAVDTDALGLRVVTPVFLDDRPGGPKIISFYAKKARGAMARFIIERRLVDPGALSDFDLGGYVYRAELSSPDRPAFLRAQDAA